MPLKKFECIDGVKIPIEDCLKEGGCRLGNRCATRSYLMKVSQDRVWKGKPSTTMLIAGTMQAFLRITRDYAVSPDQRAFMVLGTSAHKALEIMKDEYSLLEQIFDDDTIDITGIPDVIETENGIVSLVDRKTSGSYKIGKSLGFWIDEEPTGEVFKSGPRKGEPKTQKMLKQDQEHKDVWDWTLQLNNYRMLAEKKHGLKVDKLKIESIVRDGGTYIARSRGVFLNLYYFDIPFMPDDQVNEYFQRKKTALFNALKDGYCQLPCDEKENWNGLKCENYCEVAEYCKLGKYLKQERERNVMPIKGLSEARRLPRLGKIRLGIKVKNEAGKEYPKEVDYFILDPQIPDPLKKEAMIKQFHKLYGEQPKRIQIMFPVVDSGVFFQQYYKRYGSSTLLQCKGDGDLAFCSSDEFTKNLEVVGKNELGLPIVKCGGKQCPYYADKKCTEVGTLSVFLPELEGIGIWSITTGSINSIINLNSSIDLIKAAVGRCHMIPLTLERRREELSHEGKKSAHYIMNVSTAIKLADLQKQAQIEPDRILLELDASGIETNEDILDSRVEIPEKTLGSPDMTFPDETKDEPKEQPPDKPADKTLLTGTQLDAITKIVTRKGMSSEVVKEMIGQMFGVDKVSELSNEEATKLIAEFQKEAK